MAKPYRCPQAFKLKSLQLRTTPCGSSASTSRRPPADARNPHCCCVRCCPKAFIPRLETLPGISETPRKGWFLGTPVRSTTIMPLWRWGGPILNTAPSMSAVEDKRKLGLRWPTCPPPPQNAEGLRASPLEFHTCRVYGELKGRATRNQGRNKQWTRRPCAGFQWWVPSKGCS